MKGTAKIRRREKKSASLRLEKKRSQSDVQLYFWIIFSISQYRVRYDGDLKVRDLHITWSTTSNSFSNSCFRVATSGTLQTTQFLTTVWAPFTHSHLVLTLLLSKIYNPLSFGIISFTHIYLCLSFFSILFSRCLWYHSSFPHRFSHCISETEVKILVCGSHHKLVLFDDDYPCEICPPKADYECI